MKKNRYYHNSIASTFYKYMHDNQQWRDLILQSHQAASYGQDTARLDCFGCISNVLFVMMPSLVQLDS